ncbi:Uncharacterized conserved protein YloU, alkaline shock protein (Asp23) family [Friedmanniella luteola]|uniref:Uncharacterized conserved protein YloU, alkaline shock protein (Asp23) family n=1 Tax=Friedmanniella luteola TaxID=546871 RepID=A0A1H1W7R5_9ACTN|nr:Asp23/Gls24 family envelope stress response protein [Friedmanniella luteola]SDS92506.1 Uncharacterized conserved protein YloU, alkaline shock protein (Asp23) family [Friedmanniella luteola]
MTSTSTAPAPVADSRGSRPSGSRGTTTLAGRVVEKVVGQVASEIAVVGGTSGGLLGVGSHGDLSARPTVDVVLAGRTATVSLEVAVAYPTPIRQAADQVRRRVVTRVRQLTGVEVTRVDITITTLQPAAPQRGRELA